MNKAAHAEAKRRLAAADAPGALAIVNKLLHSAVLPTEERASLLWLRASVHEALQDPATAVADLETAVTLAPADSRLWNELGVLCSIANRTERAAAAFQRALAIDPRNARAWNNLGKWFDAAGRLPEAAAAFERAVATKPDYVLALVNLGAAYRDLGDGEKAEAALRRALTVDGRSAAALAALGSICREQGRIDEAVAAFARAAQMDPRDAQSCLNLGYALAERDDVTLAVRAYADACSRDPSNLRGQLGARLTLPTIPASAAAIAVSRATFDRGTAELAQILPTLARSQSPTAVLDGLRWSNFLLAYQGRDDRDLQARYAALVGDAIAAVAPAWRAPLPPRNRPPGRLRVGFASSFFRDGTVGRYFEHWVTDLDAANFDVTLYHLQPGTDALFDRLSARADRVRHCPRWVPSRVAPRIREDELDVLIYPELGMDTTTFVLAALRLAPLQCAAWGHPVTSGHATIDVYFSSEAMEPPDGETHYTERLVRLPGIGTRYTRIAPPDDARRARFGLPDDVPLLLCPQSLFKIHPDNDVLFARVLAAAPDARLVLFEGRHPALTASYLARLDAALAQAGVARASRIHVLPQCGHDDYLRINRLCAAMLDTLHWSGGNTTLDALACGLPIVTLPGRLMRGRQSAGMLRLMGVDDLIARDADDYVRIAARLALDRNWGAEIVSAIAKGGARLFDDRAPIAALSLFLQNAVAPANAAA